MIGLERQWGVRRLVRAGSGARGIRLAALFALAGAGGSSAIAQSYGLNEQVLVIGASEFRPIEEAPAAPMSNTDGYVYGSATSATDYSAPVTLPEGAEITMLCLYAYDADPGAVVGTEMHAFKLVPAGTDPGRIQVPGTFLNTSWDFGYGVVCSDPLSFTYRTTGDIDGDDVPENVTYRVAVVLNHSTVNGFGGVRIFWHRQVSPQPGAASFNDVPLDHPFSQFIEALASSGITGGCGNGNYCPDAPLTRGQMAVFLAKALGLHWGE